MAQPRAIPTRELLGRELTEDELAGGPGHLYTEGPLSHAACRPAVAVAGTRNPSAGGLVEARAVSAWLASNGAAVVSGLASGIDTMAHETAMQAGGRTIAVLGTPLDRQYPESNEWLRRRIAAGHLVISQFPNGGGISRGNFVARNRTIALLSDAAIIVEAGERSGTLHLAREALRLRRPLFICRPLYDANPAWLAGMIAGGATLLDDYPSAFAGMLDRRQPPTDTH